jgi:hypothetical protein
MTTKLIPIKSFHVLHYPGAQGIEMDITHQFKKIRVFLTQYRFKTVLKKMASANMPTVEIQSMSGKKSLHYCGDGNAGGSKKQMKVIGHQRPCITFGLGILQNTFKAFQEFIPILIVLKNNPVFYAPGDDVVQ